VRKLADEQLDSGGGKRLTISVVYESIKNSNSSLKRRKRNDLENSIDRALMRMRELEDDSESLEGDFDGIEEAGPVVKVENQIIPPLLFSNQL